MGDYLLEAEANPLFATDAISTHSTKVKYGAPFPIFLWRRVNGTSWTPEMLGQNANSLEEAEQRQKSGNRTTPDLKAGEFVEYGMLLEPYIDPNAPWFQLDRFVAYFAIDVLLGSSTLAAATPDAGLFPGGTFVRKIVATTPKTRLRIKIGREPAVAVGSNGFLILPNAIAERFSGLAQQHDVEIDPLISGTRYVALTLLIDETGAWQAIEENFTTKRRKVTIQFKNFKVENDGDEDPWGDGDDAEVFFRVYNGLNMQEQLKWGPGQITDEGAGSLVSLGFQDVTIGPDDLNGMDAGVSIGLYAFERDYFFWLPSKDQAEYPDWLPRTVSEVDPPGVGEARPKAKRLTLPTGRGREDVNPPTSETNFDIMATPIAGDGELQLTAKVRYVVAYE